MTEVSFCPNCGMRQARGAEFCVSCGHRQPHVTTPNRIDVEVASQTLPAPAAPPAPAIGAPGAATQAVTAASPRPAVEGSGPPAERSTEPRFSMQQLIALVVGASIAAGAVAVAITLVLSGDDLPPRDGGDSPATASIKVVETANIRAQVPVAWDVVTQARDTIVVEDQSSRALWLRSAAVPAMVTLDQVQERFLDHARDQAPDARVCAGPETAALPGGPLDGRYFVVCSTFIPQGGGSAVRLTDAFYIGIWGGSTVSVMQLTAVPNGLEAFATEVRSLPPPDWKLHR